MMHCYISVDLSPFFSSPSSPNQHVDTLFYASFRNIKIALGDLMTHLTPWHDWDQLSLWPHYSGGSQSRTVNSVIGSPFQNDISVQISIVKWPFKLTIFSSLHALPKIDESYLFLALTDLFKQTYQDSQLSSCSLTRGLCETESHMKKFQG